jgi:hypothetical protein
MRLRAKDCDLCKKEFPTMYRIQYKLQKVWVFVCKDCVIAIKKDNPYYRYGGTWKK